jgi:flagellar biogenesis protein FliO
VRLAAYYVLLGLAVWLVMRVFPATAQLLERFREMSALGIVTARRGRDLEQIVGPAAQTLSQGEWAAVTLLSMLTALLLVLPVSWVYMLTKQRSGYDQSVVQTVIILPMTVAGTVILVQNSLALAFTLAAIVAAVRFRNTLKDTKDAVYIFLALAVGVAAGVVAPTVAAVMSVVFNAVVLALWKSNVGNIYADQRARTPPLPPAEALLGPRRRASAELVVGDPDLLAALTPRQLEQVADRAARLQAYVAARADDKKEDRFSGVLLVHTTQPEVAQRIVEEILQAQTNRWLLAEVLPAERGRSTLEYLIRLREGLLATGLLDALKSQGTPPIDAAEFRSLRGLKAAKGE